MGQPSLEDFRRWLQTEINSLESEESGISHEERLLQLETALQEAMAFSAAWQLRTEASILPVVREKSVRLLSDAPQKSATSGNTVFCNTCETEIEEDLGFCPVCGENL